MSAVAYALVFAASLLISGGLVSYSRQLAVRIDALDHPDGGRKTQSAPIPRLGGVAVALSLTIVWTTATLLVVGKDGLPLIMGVMVPGVAIALVGLMDDRHNLNPWLRLLLQALIAIGALAGGSSVELTSNTVVNGVAFVLWVMIVVNAVNLLDNSDGLAGSTVLVSSVASATVAFIFGQSLVAALAVALAGVAAGFLWHNWHPATVYLGDSGAYFLGFMLAIVVVRLRPENLPPLQALAIAVLLVALPLVDLVYVVTRRVYRGVHPFTAGTDHLSHTVQRRGMSVPQAVLILEASLVATSGLAVVVAFVSL